MIDLTRLSIKSGDTVECIKSIDIPSPGFSQGKIFTVDHFVISGMRQLLYDSEGQYVFAEEVAIYDKKEETPETPTERNKRCLERILETVFPGEWCLYNEPTIGSSSNKYVIIRFHEFVITNSNGDRHTIRDLYVKVKLTDSWCIRGSSIDGMRTTLLEREMASSYRHSHLPSASSLCGFSGFCTGGDMIAELGILLTNKNVYENEDMYENYFETLNTYVRWESLEGGPYRRMSNIAATLGLNYSFGEPGYNDTTKQIITRILKAKGIKVPIVLDLNQHSRRIESTTGIVKIDQYLLAKKLMDVVTDDLENNRNEFTSTLKSFLCISSGGNTYRVNRSDLFQEIFRSDRITERSITEVSRTNSELIFKGERVQYVILRENGITELNKSNIEVSTSVVRAYCKDLILNFYGKFYEKGNSIFERSKLRDKSCIESIC